MEKCMLAAVDMRGALLRLLQHLPSMERHTLLHERALTLQAIRLRLSVHRQGNHVAALLNQCLGAALQHLRGRAGDMKSHGQSERQSLGSLGRCFPGPARQIKDGLSCWTGQARQLNCN